MEVLLLHLGMLHFFTTERLRWKISSISFKPEFVLCVCVCARVFQFSPWPKVVAFDFFSTFDCHFNFKPFHSFKCSAQLSHSLTGGDEFLRTHIHTLTYIHTSIHTSYTHTYTLTHIHTHLQTYVHTYTHTHIHHTYLNT